MLPQDAAGNVTVPWFALLNSYTHFSFLGFLTNLFVNLLCICYEITRWLANVSYFVNDLPLHLLILSPSASRDASTIYQQLLPLDSKTHRGPVPSVRPYVVPASPNGAAESSPKVTVAWQWSCGKTWVSQWMVPWKSEMKRRWRSETMIQSTTCDNYINFTIVIAEFTILS